MGAKWSDARALPFFGTETEWAGADVIFGEDGDSNLMGATTLQALGLVLDPLRRELRPLPMVL